MSKSPQSYAPWGGTLTAAERLGLGQPPKPLERSAEHTPYTWCLHVPITHWSFLEMKGKFAQIKEGSFRAVRGADSRGGLWR